MKDTLSLLAVISNERYERSIRLLISFAFTIQAALLARSSTARGAEGSSLMAIVVTALKTDEINGLNRILFYPLVSSTLKK